MKKIFSRKCHFDNQRKLRQCKWYFNWQGLNYQRKHKKQTFGTEQKNIEEFFALSKRQTKHSAAICVGATADLMRQWYRVKLSLEDICDSKSKNLINVKGEDSMSLNNTNESSRKEWDIPDIIISKICKNG